MARDNDPIQTIQQRRSVRTYDGAPVAQDLLDKVMAYANGIQSPFGVRVQFKLLDVDRDHLSSPVITGARTYLGAKVARQAGAEESFGYAFESVVLFATELGLGTVWLAATIDRKAFEAAMDLAPDEVMPAVSPLGHASDRMSLREKAMRKALKADDRLPFGELFFAGDFAHPLAPKAAGAWRPVLEAIRVAPSATNKQPWRVVVTDGALHLYEQHTKGYAKDATGDIQKVNLGIAACHLERTAAAEGIRGTFTRDANPQVNMPEGCKYLFSFVRE